MPSSSESLSSSAVRCPECGGLIGATKTTDAGHPCTCFSNSDFSSARNDSEHDVNDPSGTQVLESPAQPAKVCCKCGKDLRGHRRLKDSLGYWCINCHRADEKSNEIQGVRCPECGRTVKPDALIDFEGKKICSRCVKQHREIRKPGSKRFRPIKAKAFERHEMQRLLVLFLVMAVLGTIVLLNRMGIIGERASRKQMSPPNPTTANATQQRSPQATPGGAISNGAAPARGTGAATGPAGAGPVGAGAAGAVATPQGSAPRSAAAPTTR